MVAGLVFATGFSVLALAWAGGNPPAAAPDEDSHVVKAFATGHGDIAGEPYEADLDDADARTAAWFKEVGRSYSVPAALAPTDTIRCFAFDRDRTADCQELGSRAGDRGASVLAPTHFGTYSPALYLPIGLSMRNATDYRSAEWRGRLTVIGLNTLFVTWSALLLCRHRQRWIPLAGLALAVTPTVVFLSANVGTSGLEITAAICFWVALLRLTRDSSNFEGAPWAAAAVSGAAMALSRPISVLLMAIIVLAVALLANAQVVVRLFSAARAKALLAGGVIGAAVAVSALWSIFVTPQPPFDGELAKQALREWPASLPNQIQQAIGVFGWNDTPMPRGSYLLVLFLLGAACAAALLVATRKERRVLVGILAVAALSHAGLTLLVPFWMQARYVLPLAVGVPLVTAELLATHRLKLKDTWIRRGVAVVFIAMGLLQFVAFATNVHRYAIGSSGAWRLPWDAQWVPDGGFLMWFSLATVGAVLLMAPGLLSIPRWLPAPLSEIQGRQAWGGDSEQTEVERFAT
jgi:hypothetical protein